ncbi:GNAT family N-acetyltransferase [Sphingomonas japonica]|uniref:GNAT superfamily N-acetyltransferase n=1 Tax=Sphingomonas japonica TaxID=511662 RepID=A0ABX0TXB9_9SPHN|nr:GNAT family N-acetyltransferase [Sphingomonas japonica]NIJ22949.1 GNAT superfamily N-acetyltransferase [Sphingomonas japonica]
MALIPVTDDHVAAVVTTLEMHARPRPAPLPDAPLRLVRWDAPDPARYRALFERVGSPWLWYSRLAMDDAQLIAATHRTQTQVHAVLDRGGIEVGLLELSHPEPDWCALDFFGLVPELTGRGYGRWLMALAMALAWRPGVGFVRVNTCSLDHPAALGFYVRAGFTATKRTLETFPDPRAIGVLPPETAPQVPLLGKVATAQADQTRTGKRR